MFTLVAETPLSDIPNVSELDMAFENLNDGPVIRAEGDETSDNSNRVQSPNNIPYTIRETQSETGKIVSFYMNVLNLTKQAINQFVMLCEVLVREQDVLIVHFNSSIYCEEAETIYNAILDCKARKKIGSAPYTLNTAALYPLLACDYAICSPYQYAHFDVPSIKAGGNLRDADNGINYDKYRKLRMLHALADAGFIPEEQMEKILKRQGSYSIYGQQYVDIITKFNSRNK